MYRYQDNKLLLIKAFILKNFNTEKIPNSTESLFCAEVIPFYYKAPCI